MKYKDYKQLTDDQKEELKFKYSGPLDKYFKTSMSCYLIAFIFIAAVSVSSLVLMGLGVESVEGDAEVMMNMMTFVIDLFLVCGWISTITQWVTLFKKDKFVKRCKEENENTRNERK